MVWGAALFDQVAGVVLLALIDWDAGVRLQAWVSHVCIGTCGCPVLAPQTMLGHLGPLLGGIPCHQSLLLAFAEMSL